MPRVPKNESSKRLEPLIQTKASRPFEAVSVDLGYLEGVDYLILVDRYTGWPLVKKLTKLNIKLTLL